MKKFLGNLFTGAVLATGIIFSLLIVAGLVVRMQGHREHFAKLRTAEFNVVFDSGYGEKTLNVSPVPAAGKYELRISRSMSPHYDRKWQRVHEDEILFTDKWAYGDGRHFPVYISLESENKDQVKLTGLRLPDQIGGDYVTFPEALNLEPGAQYSLYIFDRDNRRFIGDTTFKAVDDCKVYFATT